MKEATLSGLAGLPSMNELLNHPRVLPWIDQYGREVIKHFAREEIATARAAFQTGRSLPTLDVFVANIGRGAAALVKGSLRPVINGTGIVLHTNLSRAPLGPAVMAEVVKIATGYSSLEYDTTNACRGSRNVHLRDVLRFLTGAQDAIVVNNNAAALVLALATLAANKEVLISRGELIEIGGSFRIPEIMAASGARMVEVGTTNRTRISDFEAAIGPNTAMIFKAHQSNFSMRGFVEEASIAQLANLAHAHNLVMVYDLGSGLLRRPPGLPLDNEPDVKSALDAGADLVCFSGDKLLGGPQAGIIVGREAIVSRLASAPLMRALRVCKLTYAALTVVCRQYFKDETLLANNPTFAMLGRSPADLEQLATALIAELSAVGIEARAVPSDGQCGGGTLPDLRIPSVAVEVLPRAQMGTARTTFAEWLFARLNEAERPVLGILREGKFLIDVLTLTAADIPIVASVIEGAIAAGEPL